MFVGERLIEANQEQQFIRGVEDLEMWLSETENQLKSEDLGKVFIPVFNLKFIFPFYFKFNLIVTHLSPHIMHPT